MGGQSGRRATPPSEKWGNGEEQGELADLNTRWAKL